jgi:hypothetical protein
MGNILAIKCNELVHECVDSSDSFHLDTVPKLPRGSGESGALGE